MFEAARNMKTGVTNIKDLDMSLVKKRNAPKLNPQCQVVFEGSPEKKIDTAGLTFDLNSRKLFNTDADSEALALKCWSWLLNPVSVESVAGKKLFAATNRGNSFDQPDPEDDLVSLQVFKSTLQMQAGFRFGEDIDVFRVIADQRTLLNPSCEVTEELVSDMLLH